MKKSQIHEAENTSSVNDTIRNALLTKEYPNIISQLHQLLDLQKKQRMDDFLGFEIAQGHLFYLQNERGINVQSCSIGQFGNLTK